MHLDQLGHLERKARTDNPIIVVGRRVVVWVILVVACPIQQHRQQGSAVVRRGSPALPLLSRLDLSSTAAQRRQCDGDNGHSKRLVHLSHEERKQQQQQSTHSHTPDLTFTLAFAVLVVSAFVVSIALVGCCVVRSRHVNCWAVRHGELLPSPPPPPRRRCRRPPPPATLISSSPSSNGVGQAAAMRGPPIP